LDTVVHNSFKHYFWLSEELYELLVWVLNLVFLCPFVFHTLTSSQSLGLASPEVFSCYDFFLTCPVLYTCKMWDLSNIELNKHGYNFQCKSGMLNQN